jgi:hypothetical protein
MDKRIGYTYNPSGITEMPFDSAQPYQVFDLSGQSRGNDLQCLPQGMYIVRQNGCSRKIQVK